MRLTTRSIASACIRRKQIAARVAGMNGALAGISTLIDHLLSSLLVVMVAPLIVEVPLSTVGLLYSSAAVGLIGQARDHREHPDSHNHGHENGSSKHVMNYTFR